MSGALWMIAWELFAVVIGLAGIGYTLGKIAGALEKLANRK